MALITCVLKTGGEYGPEHVDWLRQQVRQFDSHADFVCLTDDVRVTTDTIQLKHGYPGWWSKIELCRPEIRGDILFLDLDTVIVGNLTRLFRAKRSTMLRDVYRGGRTLQSSVMFLTEADRKQAWMAWNIGPHAWMERKRSLGDQGFFEAALPSCAQWQVTHPGLLVSYKADIRAQNLDQPPSAASVVVFHGKPRPWDVNESWIPKLKAENVCR